uniref:Tyr recombinase domain-containing protein n=1 Tax=Ulva lactuca TaxID=63410 RepID=A0A4D5XWL1_ULVLA|nr:hypothetical protein [Ulva lactuca]QBS47966.1 hypothetical protein [Ulva lactuca]
MLEFDFNQIVILITKHYLQFSRKKAGPVNKKAYIEKKKRYILRNRLLDVQYLLQSNGILVNFESKDINEYMNSTALEIYVFSSKKNKQPLSRSTLTHEFNNILKEIPQFKEAGKRITSHSFRHGLINYYWKTLKDIELARQMIGHARLDTTQRYIKALTPEELQERIELATETSE